MTELKVVAVSPGVAGGYACRLLADAGADVEVLIPPEGLKLSRWSSSGSDRASGLLFDHLLGDARQVHLSDSKWQAGLAEADVIIFDLATGGEDRPADAVRTAVDQHSRAVRVVITPFGDPNDGEYPPETEFTFQARCGSIGGRGNPDEKPIAAGGRIGEWSTGVFAAIASLAALEQQRTSGGRPEVYVSMFESMVSVFNCFEWLRGRFFDPPRELEPWLDVPSAEQASDGWVGITAITPDQWRAFVDMTQAEEFRGDHSLELLLNRVGMRRRLDQVCGPWLRSHTVEQILDEAERRRIPSAPVLNGATVTEAEHFRMRDTFRTSADGRYLRPASPVIIDGQRMDRSDGGPLADWIGLDRSAPPVPDGADSSVGPLAGINVLDLSAFWAGPSAAQVLSHLGASVIKIEGVTRPDGMRLVSPRGRGVEHWWEYNGIFHGANSGKTAVSVDLSYEGGRELLYRLAREADVLVENSPADVMGRLGVSYEALRERNPRIIMLRMPAFGLTGPWSARRGYATTMDHVSGIAWLTGEVDGPPTSAKVADFNGGAHAAFAILVALARRARSGTGAHLEVSLADGALAIAAEQVIEYSGANALLTRDGGGCAAAAPQGLYLSNDGYWVAISVCDDVRWKAMAEALELPTDLARRCASHELRRGAREEIDNALAARCSQLTADAIVTLARKAQVAAERVVSPSAVDRDPYLEKGGFIRTLEHRLHGPLSYTTLPFTIDGARYGPSVPAPMFGEHNHMLAVLAGVDQTMIDGLRASGVIADRPAL